MVGCDVKFVLRSGGAELVRVTVSGHPGSGTSTLVTNLCGKLNWSNVNGGDIFREEAARRGVTLEDFSELCLSNKEVDRELDAELKRRMLLDGGPEVVESRLAGWWAYKLELSCARVWIDVSEEERAKRVVNREGGTIDGQRSKIIQRMDADSERYSALYGINLDSLEPYDCIIEGDNLSPESVLSVVLTHLEELDE